MLDPLRAESLRVAELVAQLELDPTASVVADVGAGPGFLTLPLARAARRVIATDVEPRYLAHLAAEAARAKLTNVETRHASPEAPGLDPASIDIAVLCQVDHYLRDRAQNHEVVRGDGRGPGAGGRPAGE